MTYIMIGGPSPWHGSNMNYPITFGGYEHLRSWADEFVRPRLTGEMARQAGERVNTTEFARDAARSLGFRFEGDDPPPPTTERSGRMPLRYPVSAVNGMRDVTFRVPQGLINWVWRELQDGENTGRRKLSESQAVTMLRTRGFTVEGAPELVPAAVPAAIAILEQAARDTAGTPYESMVTRFLGDMTGAAEQVAALSERTPEQVAATEEEAIGVRRRADLDASRAHDRQREQVDEEGTAAEETEYCVTEYRLEQYSYTYYVEASSEEEALEMCQNGDVDVSDDSGEHYDTNDTWYDSSVEEC